MKDPRAGYWRRAGAALAAALLCAPAGHGGEFQLRLSVTEPAGVSRRAGPISGGIPLPAGRFRKGQVFALFGKDGRRIPSQALPLVTDRDGTVRWVLLDFQDDLAAGATKTYVLRPAKAATKPARPLKVARGGNGVTVDTGAITFTIPRTKPFALFGSARAAAKPVVAGGRLSYTDGLSGKTYLADRPSRIEVARAGPMRATVVVRGQFIGDDDNAFQYVARVTAWVGKSEVHVKYSLCNSNPKHYCYRTVRDSSIELKPAGKPSGCVLGAAKPLAAGAEARLVQALRATAAGSTKAYAGGKELWVSGGAADVAEGWIAATIGESGIYVCDLYFADDPARQLALADGRLVLSGVAERWRNPRTDRRGREVARPYASLRRCIYDCSHLSSQYLIDFDAPADPKRLSRAAKAARNRLWALALPEWYLHREALPFGRFGTQADEIACYRAWGWKFDPKAVPRRPRRTYPRFHPGTDNHYRPEEDPLDQLLIMYLRTGRRPYFDNARSWANYWMDLYAWRTDGWRHRDGGVWWYTGPKGNRPRRAADPVTATRNHIPAPWAKKLKPPWTKPMVDDSYFLANSKSCYCHNWGQGLLAWYCLTGDSDALEAALDRVEQDFDTQKRAFRKAPGKADDFSRDFNRASYLAHAARMIVPDNDLAREASEFYARVYLSRPTREPRGLVNGARRWRRPLRGGLKEWVGQRGLEALRKTGFEFNERTGQLTDPATGRKWYVICNPHTWMFPPLSRAMELYHRLTGDEDAMDWTIAYGQAAARVLYQDHGLLTYGKMLVDFPERGVARDYASWVAPAGSRHAEGLAMSGYLARFHPDVCARAYSLCGEPLLRRRAYEYWLAGSHRGYRRKKMYPTSRVAMWVDYHSDHDGQTDFVGRTFYVWARGRKDAEPPHAIRDLTVTVAGDRARITFTAPADPRGKIARYQVKCSDRPIVDYERFLRAYRDFEDGKVCNWWMATNLRGEPAPRPPGRTESFTVAGVPAGARHFAVRSFDEAGNRSAMSNVCRATVSKATPRAAAGGSGSDLPGPAR